MHKQHRKYRTMNFRFQRDEAVLCVRSLVYYGTAAKCFLLRKVSWDILLNLLVPCTRDTIYRL